MKNTFKYYAGMLLIGVTLANIRKYFRAHCTSLGYS